MLKKCAVILLASLISLNLSCCAPSGQSGAKDFDNLTANTIPTLEETKSFSLDQKAALRVAMGQLPLEDCERVLSKQISEFCESDGVAELIELHLDQDKLSLVKGENKKPIENLIVDIKINLLHSEDPAFQAVTASKEFFSRLNHYLRTLPYTGFLTKEITISASYDGLDPVNTFKSSVSYVDPIAFSEQSESELASQTTLYYFAEKNKSFQLQKFGAIPETQELYVEYYLMDDILLDETVQTDRHRALEEKYLEIKKLLLDEKSTGQYVEENNLTSLTVSFQSSLLDDGFMTFHENL